MEPVMSIPRRFLMGLVLTVLATVCISGAAALSAVPGGTQPDFNPVDSNSKLDHVLVQPDGKIVYGGTTVQGAKGSEMIIGRALPNGVVDQSMGGTAGYVVLGSGFDNDNDVLAGMVRMPNGEFILGDK